MSEKLLTTKEIRQLECWPKIKESLNEAFEDFKKVYPKSKVELVDKGFAWWVVVDGDPCTEIDCLDLQRII